MPSVIENLKPTLAGLSEDERAELAYFLLQSLNERRGDDSRRDLLTELDRRWHEIESGEEKGVPAEVVHARLRTRFP